jgi:hypothetical protein
MKAVRIVNREPGVREHQVATLRPHVKSITYGLTDDDRGCALLPLDGVSDAGRERRATGEHGYGNTRQQRR